MEKLTVESRLGEEALKDMIRGFESYIEDTESIMISDYEYDIGECEKLFVDFEVLMHHRLDIKKIEICDEDWITMHAETAFVKPYIEDIIERYNRKIECEIGDGYNYKGEWK